MSNNVKLLDKYQDGIKLFVDTAKKFCDLVENSQKINQREFWHQSCRLLLQLVQYGFDLPDIASIGEQPLKSNLSQDDYLKLQREISKQFDKYNYHWFIYDPVEGGEPVGSTLSMDLVDIYQELKTGLDIYEKEEIDAIWHWRFGFYATNWGPKAVNALTSIFNLLVTY